MVRHRKSVGKTSVDTTNEKEQQDQAMATDTATPKSDGADAQK